MTRQLSLEFSSRNLSVGGDCPPGWQVGHPASAGVLHVRCWSPRDRIHVSAMVNSRIRADVERLSWRLDSKGYPCATSRGRLIYLHHLAVGEIVPGKMVDHINRDILDARDANLRWLSPAESAVNKRRPRRVGGSSSRYRGVTLIRYRSGNTAWQAAISVNGRCRYIGVYRSETRAAIAYNRAARKQWPSLYQRNRIPVRRTVTTAWAAPNPHLEDDNVNRTLTFTFASSTKNTHRFSELDAAGRVVERADAVVGTLYVKKSAFEGEQPPRTITVSLAA